MAKRSLLLVDGDASSLRVLEVSLRKAGFNVTTALTAEDALNRVRTAKPDLVISATQIVDDLDGFDFCAELKGSSDWRAIPFIFVAEKDSLDEKIRGLELGVEDYLVKPLYIKEIITRIRILLQKRERSELEEKKDTKTRFTGSLVDMGVVDLLQTIELSRKSGLIHVTSPDSRQATVYFRDGVVVDAETGRLQGEDAVYRLLTWTDGHFEVLFRNVRRRDVIQMATQGLLMEGMRRLDEWGRLLEQLPPVDTRFQLDFEELAVRLPDLPDELNSILRLFDGRRSLLNVIDESTFSDLESLEIVSRLYFEGVIIEAADLGVPEAGFERIELGPSGTTVPPPIATDEVEEEVVQPPADMLLEGEERSGAENEPSPAHGEPSTSAAGSEPMSLIDAAIGSASPVVDEESGRILAGVTSFVAEATAVEVAAWNESDDRRDAAASEAESVLSELKEPAAETAAEASPRADTGDEAKAYEEAIQSDEAWFRPKRPESESDVALQAREDAAAAEEFAERLSPGVAEQDVAEEPAEAREELAAAAETAEEAPAASDAVAAELLDEAEVEVAEEVAEAVGASGVPAPIDDGAAVGRVRLKSARGRLAPIVDLNSVRPPRRRPSNTQEVVPHGGIVSSQGEDKAQAYGELTGPDFDDIETAELGPVDLVEVSDDAVPPPPPARTRRSTKPGPPPPPGAPDGPAAFNAEEALKPKRSSREVLIPNSPPPSVTSFPLKADADDEDDELEPETDDVERLRRESHGSSVKWAIAGGGAAIAALILASFLFQADDKEKKVAPPVDETPAPQQPLRPEFDVQKPATVPDKKDVKAPDPDKKDVKAPDPDKKDVKAPDPDKKDVKAPDPDKKDVKAPDPDKKDVKEPDPDKKDAPPSDDAGQDAKSLYRQARRLSRAGKSQEALDTLEKSLALKRSAKSLLLKADLLLKKRDRGGALEAASAAVKASPSSSSAWKTKGVIHLELGESGQAKAAFERYLELKPKARDREDIQLLIDSL